MKLPKQRLPEKKAVLLQESRTMPRVIYGSFGDFYCAYAKMPTFLLQAYNLISPTCLAIPVSNNNFLNYVIY